MKLRLISCRSFPHAIAIAALLSAPSASAVDFWWDGGTANWSTASAWSTVADAATPDPAAFPASSTTANLFFNRTNNNAAVNIVSMANGNRAARSLTFATSGTTNFRAGGASTAASTLTIGAGGITLDSTAGAVTVGQTPASYGTLSITLGASQIWTNNSANLLTVTGAIGGGAVGLTKTGTGQIRVNGANTFTGALEVTGGDLSIGNYSGLSNTSSITVSGGTAGLNLVQVGTGTTNNTINKTLSLHGFLRTTGGTASNRLNQTWDGNITLAGASTITNNGNSLFDINGQVDLGTHALTFKTDGTGSRIDGDLIGDGGSLIKTGNQDLTITGSNTYSGTTAINNGTLRINGTHTGGGTYTVAAVGTLRGIGSTTSQLDVSGKLSPGASVQSFASGTLNMLDGSTFEAELNSSVATSSGADLQVVSGALNLTGTVGLTLADLSLTPTAFALDTTFSLINYSGAWNDGLFTFGGDLIADGGSFTAGLNTWEIDYNAASGGLNFTGDQIVGSFVNITAVVPEPSAALLGALGSLALLRRRRK